MQTNKTIITDKSGNELRLSSVQTFDAAVHFNHFSAKYVLSGEERYTINSKNYLLKKGEYVIGNQHAFSSILIDSPQPVKGICVDVSKQKIQEVIRYTFNENKGFENFLFTEEFFTNKYNAQNTTLGGVFTTIGTAFQTLLETPNLVTNELFFSIAECIVNDQSKVYTHYSKLEFTKHETNKRLFSFLWNAKEYIDLHFQEQISVEQIARNVNLSEYHFIRLFKTVFNQTPYQYIVQQRLCFSKILLLEKCDIKEVAYQCGFADVHSFSKAFKSAFGTTPNFFKKSN